MKMLTSLKVRSASSSLERLETRIAPAGVTVSGDHETATWVDVDGDFVTLKATKAVFDPTGNQFTFLPKVAGDIGEQLALLDLHTLAATNAGVGLTFTAKRDTAGHHGDGSVNVGRINALGLDLGAVSVAGDLASIDAGDATLTTSAVASITAASAGQLGKDTQSASANPHLTWQFIGSIGNVIIKGNSYVALQATDDDGKDDNNKMIAMGNITIGGDLIGGDQTVSGYNGFGAGQIFSEGTIGAIKIGGDVVGSTTKYSGAISTYDEGVKSIFIGGNLVGSTAEFTGVIQVVRLGSLTIGGSVIGGSASDTGEALVYASLGPVKIGGSLIGGDTPRDSNGNVPVDMNGDPILIEYSGVIHGRGNIGAITINGDVQTGEGDHSGSIQLENDGKIASITIKGTLRGNGFINDANHTYHVSNGIFAGGQLGPVTIGAVLGDDPLAPVDIIAEGLAEPDNAAEALAIASVTVLRDARNVEILAGFHDAFHPTNPDVIIGPIKIGASFSGNISAGVISGDKGYGDAQSAITVPGDGFTDSALLSKITSVTVGTYVIGNPWHDTNFVNGITAQQIGAVTIGGTALELTANVAGKPLDKFVLGTTHEFLVTEV